MNNLVDEEYAGAKSIHAACADLSPRRIRERIVLAGADPFFIEGSLEDNFFGHPRPKDDGLGALADRAVLKDGDNLSSGQKKRLQLQRCFALQGMSACSTSPSTSWMRTRRRASGRPFRSASGTAPCSSSPTTCCPCQPSIACCA